MFERFTEPARGVVVLAQAEARQLRHDSIGTEHLLLGLLGEERGLAARVLASLSIEADAVREQVRAIVGEGGEEPGAQIPFDPRAKKVLELSLREALALGHNYIGTEHVLLGLAREHGGVAAQILDGMGAKPEAVHAAVIAALGGQAGELPPRGFSARRHRRRWAYRVLDLPEGEITEAWLQPLGDDGWQLVAIVERRAVFVRQR